MNKLVGAIASVFVGSPTEKRENYHFDETHSAKSNQRNASRSKRKMLLERGAVPDDIGARRFIRRSEKAKKAKEKRLERAARREGL